MQHIITILIAILIFGLIIGIHEFGHFIVAKLNHIQVNGRFGFFDHWSGE